MEDIAELLKTLRFKKKLLFGVDERDVWHKLSLLQKEYRAAFDAQEVAYKALLAERDAMIASLTTMQSGESQNNRGNINE